MYRYDIKLMEKYVSTNPDLLEILIEYCQKTLEDDARGIIDHWRRSQSDFRDLSKNLKTFKLNYQLYNNLVRHHEMRIETAKNFLELHKNPINR